MPTRPLGTYGRSAGFLRLHDELLDSNAFLALSANAQRVLIDFLRAHAAATRFDTEQPPLIEARTPTTAKSRIRGVRYSFATCRFDIGRTDFYRCIAELAAYGFIKRANVPTGHSYIIIPSQDWKRCPREAADAHGAARIARVRKRTRHYKRPGEQTYFTLSPQTDRFSPARTAPQPRTSTAEAEHVGDLLADLRRSLTTPKPEGRQSA